MLAAGEASAQALDGTLEDVIEDQIDEQVESEVADSLAQSVEQQVESSVTESVEQQVESSVAESVEQQIESGVAESVEQQIESGITQSVEEQLDSTLTDAVVQELESGVVGAVEQQLDATIGDVLEGDLGSALERNLEQVLESGSDVLDEAIGDRDGAGQQDGDGQTSGAASGSERFVAAIDEAGRTIERDVWIILVPAEHVARIDTWGFDIQEQQALTALDRTLVRVTAPEDRSIAQAALDLALDAPGTLVDFNHIYGAEAGETDDDALVAKPVVTELAPASARDVSITIGIIDTAVAAHEGLPAAGIARKDFVRFAASRPSGHGTAVASILLCESAALEGQLRGATLYAASVFFEDDEGNVLATTQSLVEALEWLTAERVPVINMSLSGPPNRVLEAAIGAVAARGRIIVAAVGNNGPVGEPLFPAAYAPVIGVTAVDAQHGIYRYANRGRQVTFAAPGVDVPVARAGGGYGTQSGTSMAAPHAAAIIARSLARVPWPDEGVAPAAEVLARLKRSAIDLGDEDFDEVFGFGLIVAVE
jgi:subtilisin family serine protease